MKALLFAAGLGTRLRPLTDIMPKALVPINGIPLIDLTLSKLIQAGVNEVVVNVHHFGEQIIHHLEQYYRDRLHIIISDERKLLLDTGGGLKQALSLFSTPRSPILLHNVDILSNANLSFFYQQLKEETVLLMVSRRDTQRYLLFDKSMKLVGWTNLATGEIKSPYPHLRVEDCQRYAFAGIHCVTTDIAEAMTSYPDVFSITRFYIEQCHNITIRGIVIDDLRLLDVGKLDSIQQAETLMRELF